jgi:hypothetical protein
MKKTIFTITTAITLFLMSCGGGKTETKESSAANSKEAIELKGFMLGGMYFFNGFGGVGAVESSIANSDSPEDMIKGYSETFIFAFQKEQGSDIKSMFSSMWDINNKADLEKTIKDLMTRKNNFKAWDYARIVNNASMGYAADYLSKEEVKKYVAETLVLAQKDFKDWDSYIKNFNEGRLDWNKNDPEKASYDKVCAEMAKNPKGLYQYLKLN